MPHLGIEKGGTLTQKVIQIMGSVKSGQQDSNLRPMDAQAL
jgi:hypothetical protein